MARLTDQQKEVIAKIQKKKTARRRKRKAMNARRRAEVQGE